MTTSPEWIKRQQLWASEVADCLADSGHDGFCSMDLLDALAVVGLALYKPEHDNDASAAYFAAKDQE